MSSLRRWLPTFQAGHSTSRGVIFLSTLTTLVIVLCYAIRPGSRQQALSGDSIAGTAAGSQVVGYVGLRPIYLADINRLIQSQLAELDDQAYRLRRKALDSEIDRILIDELANAKGVAPAVVRHELTAFRAITESEVDNVYQKSKSRLPPEPESKAKDRIRQILQRQLQKRAYLLSVNALRDAGNVQILLRRPSLSRDEFRRLNGVPLGAKAPGAVRVIVFSDYQCPYCRRADEQLIQLASRYGDRIRIEYKQFPLGNHAVAQKAAEATLCAHEQGAFAEYHSMLFRQGRDLSFEHLKEFAHQLPLDYSRFTACLDSGKMAGTVQRDREQGIAIGVRATPTLVVDGEVLRGLPPPGELDSTIRRALRSRSNGEPRFGW